MPYFQKAQGRGNCGFFETLPIELLHYIFDYLPLTEIGQLALASDALRVKVANWIWTTKCQNRAVFKFSQLFTNEFDVLTIPATQLGRTVVFYHAIYYYLYFKPMHLVWVYKKQPIRNNQLS